MKKIKINEIPSLKYDGYLWYSDEDRPRIIEEGKYIERESKALETFWGATFCNSDLDEHPFVVEGALYSKEKNISITIRNIDGEYLAHQFDLKELDTEHYRNIEHSWFLAKDQVRKANMLEVWELAKDEHKLCAGIPSYRPVFWVFKGF